MSFSAATIINNKLYIYIYIVNTKRMYYIIFNIYVLLIRTFLLGNNFIKHCLIQYDIDFGIRTNTSQAILMNNQDGRDKKMNLSIYLSIRAVSKISLL